MEADIVNIDVCMQIFQKLSVKYPDLTAKVDARNRKNLESTNFGLFECMLLAALHTNITKHYIPNSSKFGSKFDHFLSYIDAQQATSIFFA